MPTSLELFAGGGGLALGLHRAGFEHVGLVEFDPKACDTLRGNAQRWEASGQVAAPWRADFVHEADVREFIGSDAMPGAVDLVAGGPPCQPFSLGGIHAGMDDSRNMFPAALSVVRSLKPKLVIFENVPGLIRPSFLPYFEYVEDQLRRPSVQPKHGETWRDHWRRLRDGDGKPSRSHYLVTRQVIDSADLGVPQNRRRVFLMAVRGDIADRPPPALPMTHSRTGLLYSQWVEGDYWEDHGVSQPSRPESLSEDRLLELKRGGRPPLRRWRTVRDAVADLPTAADGEAHPDVLNHVGIPGARAYPGHTGSLYDWPAKTIKAGVHGVCGGEAMIRFPDDSLRYLTVREAARIQTFPDDYEFFGARTHAMRHIGNAVAVQVAAILGRHLREFAAL